jgi:hypothetical protein
MLAFVLVLAGGCSRPPACVETYSPWMKLLVGLPIPMLVTTALAAALIVGIDNALGPSRRRIWGALLAVVVTCAEPAVLGRMLSWPEGLVVIFPASLITLVLLCLRDRGGDPNRQSWMPGLSRALEPSLSDRVGAGLLVALLVFVTFVGSMVAGFCVGEAGKRCGEVEPKQSSQSRLQ